jgi:hypothetical protein
MPVGFIMCVYSLVYVTSHHHARPITFLRYRLQVSRIRATSALAYLTRTFVHPFASLGKPDGHVVLRRYGQR